MNLLFQKLHLTHIFPIEGALLKLLHSEDVFDWNDVNWFFVCINLWMDNKNESDYKSFPGIRARILEVEISQICIHIVDKGQTNQKV